jgi:hypothetical protein
MMHKIVRRVLRAATAFRSPDQGLDEAEPGI